MPVVTIANQKGGVAKTTTTITVAHGLSIQGFQVLAVDLDPQGHVAVALGVEGGPGVFDWLVRESPLSKVIKLTERAGLTILPGNKKTGSAISFLVIEYKGAVPLDLLSEKLRPALRRGLDYVLIDTSPSATELQAAAIYAADVLLIPAACDYLSEDGVAQTMETLELAGNQERLAVGVVPTFYDSRTNECKRVLAEYQTHLGEMVLPPIHASTRFREAVAQGQTIFETDPNGRGAEEYAQLIWWIRDVAE